jgi:hypothetical protein
MEEQSTGSEGRSAVEEAAGFLNIEADELCKLLTTRLGQTSKGVLALYHLSAAGAQGNLQALIRAIYAKIVEVILGVINTVCAGDSKTWIKIV